jgi:hypothetical protein
MPKHLNSEQLGGYALTNMPKHLNSEQLGGYALTNMPKHLSSGIVAPVFVGMRLACGMYKDNANGTTDFLFHIFYCLKNQKMGISGKSCFSSLSQPSFF